MPRGIADSDWVLYEKDSSDAADTIGLANLTLSPALWASVVEKPVSLPRVDDGDVDDEMATMWVLGWVVWADGHPPRRMLPKSRRGFDRAKALQRDVCAALSAIVRGDAEALAEQINARGPFECRVSRRTVARARRASTPSAVGWHVAWVSSAEPDDTVLDHLLTTLRFADRLGHCKQCKRFFLSERRWKQPPQVCSGRCSVAFHNARRRAEGYFTKQRRKKRGT